MTLAGKAEGVQRTPPDDGDPLTVKHARSALMSGVGGFDASVAGARRWRSDQRGELGGENGRCREIGLELLGVAAHFRCHHADASAARDERRGNRAIRTASP